MYNSINSLWNGNLKPAKYFCEDDKQIKELERLIEQNKEKLTTVLKGKERNQFEIYNDCIDEYISAVCELAFCKGFGCGSKIITEASAEADSLIKY